ncbi:acetylornithine/succinylornithine family transaminase [Alphaproteobacteria bacterium HT1-32]|nr:acetylornithine/succinylornithine family transaminase [Alphaproteobacteria bacterium HT1-32]
MTSAVMPTYARFDLEFDRGEGCYLYTVDGRRFLDFTSGIAVNALGHAHPHLVKTLQEQAGKLWHVSNLYRIPDQERLAERLVAHSFADYAFFCNSGAEALECGIKMARKHFYDKGQTEKYRVICADGSFHGRTLATISAGGSAKVKKGFDPLVDAFDHVPFGNMNELRNAITPQTAAILVEPIQGEGGIQVGQLDYLRALRETADEFGILLHYDEVQCGIGRTGKLFAYEWAGKAAPDIISLAKGLGGGFPVGACLATADAASGMTAGAHGTTFGGNPLAMATANAVLDVVLGDGFLDHVDRTARALWDQLTDLQKRYPTVIEQVRGAGLMLGLKCVVDSGKFIATMMDNQMLAVGAADNVVRLLPPLIMGEAEAEQAMAALEATCKTLAAEA